MEYQIEIREIEPVRVAYSSFAMWHNLLCLATL